VYVLANQLTGSVDTPHSTPTPFPILPLKRTWLENQKKDILLHHHHFLVLTKWVGSLWDMTLLMSSSLQSNRFTRTTKESSATVFRNFEKPNQKEEINSFMCDVWQGSLHRVYISFAMSTRDVSVMSDDCNSREDQWQHVQAV